MDSDHHVIVAVCVRNLPLDVEHLELLQQRIATTAGALLELMTLDASYWSDDNTGRCEILGIDAYIAIARLPHGQPSQRGTLPSKVDAKPA